MTTIDDVLAVAVSQIGTCEKPVGSNNVKYNTWFYKRHVNGPAYPWCAVFVSWIFHKLDAKDLIHLYSAYSGDILHAMQAAGEEVSIGQAGPGDIVTFNYDGGRTDHIAIVEKRLGPVTFGTIEGNTGDCVQRRTREQSRSCYMWFTRPKYAQPQQEEDDMWSNRQTWVRVQMVEFHTYQGRNEGQGTYEDACLAITPFDDNTAVTLEVISDTAHKDKKFIAKRNKVASNETMLSSIGVEGAVVVRVSSDMPATVTVDRRGRRL